jgi:hypothetical protein
MKVLQIELQLANSISADQFSVQYLTESTVISLFSLALQLCDGSMVSVSSTAFATVRQIIAIVYDSACDSLTKVTASSSTIAPMMSGPVSSAMHFLEDLCLYSRNLPALWLRGSIFLRQCCSHLHLSSFPFKL